MFSMSSGFRKLSGSRPAQMQPPEPGPAGTPSMTYSGSLLALIEVVPRMRIEMPPPGSLLSTTCTPATLFWMSCAGLMMRPGLNCAAPSDVTAPGILPALCSP